MKQGRFLYVVQAQVTPKIRNGWQSGGRQVPSFWLWAESEDHACRIARVILSTPLADPDAAEIHVHAARWTADIVTPVPSQEAVER